MGELYIRELFVGVFFTDIWQYSAFYNIKRIPNIYVNEETQDK